MLEKNLDDLGLLGLRGKNHENERKKVFWVERFWCFRLHIISQIKTKLVKKEILWKKWDKLLALSLSKFV